MVRSISTASRAGHPRTALVFDQAFYILVLRQLFPKSSLGISALLSQGSKSDSWDGACVWVHTEIPKSAFIPQILLLPINSAQQAQSYDFEIPQGRAARFAIQSNVEPYVFTDKKTVFPQVCVFPNMEQVEPTDKVHMQGCPANYSNSLPR